MTEVGKYQPGEGAKPPIAFTDAAAEKVAALITEENNPNLKLRVFITGGGCSGFQYGFTFDEEVNSDDMVIKKAIKIEVEPEEPLHEVGEYEEDPEDNLSPDEKAGEDSTEEEDDDEGGDEGSGGMIEVLLLVDPMSFQYLIGAEIDYKEDLQGARFVIRNPNAKTTCGCGSSFSL